MLSPAEHETIATAVAKAETRTSGEIVCAIAAEVSEYREVPLAWAAGVALILPPLCLAAGLDLSPLAAPFAQWTAARGASAAGPLLSAYALIQAVLFVATAAIVALPALRRRLTPRILTRHRVHRAALQHFAGVHLHLKPGQPAVLIFVAVLERQLQLIADPIIHAKVGQAAWDHATAEALAAIRREGTAAGLVRAVEICGAALAEHFPGDGSAHTHPDAVLEI